MGVTGKYAASMLSQHLSRLDQGMPRRVQTHEVSSCGVLNMCRVWGLACVQHMGGAVTDNRGICFRLKHCTDPWWRQSQCVQIPNATRYAWCTTEEQTGAAEAVT